MRRATPTHARTTDAFTLIEVMIAIGLMTVGSLGILSMQSATMRANRMARQLSTAQNISQTWLDRLERDTLGWTTEGQTVTELGSTTYLTNLSTTITGTSWFQPISATAGDDDGEENMFDWNGEDTSTASEIRYCTHVRLTWFNLGSSVRADVRTIFIREGISTASGAVSGDQLTSSNCYASSVGTLDVTAVPNLRSVHVSKVLRFLPR